MVSEQCQVNSAEQIILSSPWRRFTYGHHLADQAQRSCLCPCDLLSLEAVNYGGRS
jgi:hypothetical protein